jgi:hypothetical protein
MKAVMPPRTKTEPSHPPSLAAALPAVPKAQSPGLMRKVTPPSGKPTQPMGVVGLATSATIPPPQGSADVLDTAPFGNAGLPITGRESTQPPPIVDIATATTLPPRSKSTSRSDTIPDHDLARGPTAPIMVPRTSTKDGPPIAPRAPIRGGSPAERLIVTSDEANAAADQLDRALDGLSAEPRDTAKGMRPLERTPAPLPLPAPDDDNDGEVVIEADEPPEREGISAPRSVVKARGLGDNSEPEISIERFVELEVEEPMNEDRDDNSAPEIMILTPGRAITADDTKLVAGSIDTRQGDARKSDALKGDGQQGDAWNGDKSRNGR